PPLDAGAAEVAERALVDDPADLQPAVVGGEAESEVAVAQVGARRAAVEERGLRDLAPDDVEGLLGAPGAEAGPRAQDRSAAVGSDHEVAPLLAAARGGVDAHADHALALADEVAHRHAPLEPEAGEAPRLRDQQLEERGLRDHARPRRAQVLRTHPEDPPGAAEDVERLDA